MFPRHRFPRALDWLLIGLLLLNSTLLPVATVAAPYEVPSAALSIPSASGTLASPSNDPSPPTNAPPTISSTLTLSTPTSPPAGATTVPPLPPRVGRPRAPRQPRVATTSPTSATAAASPTLLGSFAAPTPNNDSSGRAVGFDGTSFWLTFRERNVPIGTGGQYQVVIDPYIYNVSKTGQLLQIFNVGQEIGALAGDPTRQIFWASDYINNPGTIDTFNPSTGALTTQFSFVPPGGNCFHVNPGHIDGLAYDPSTDSLWLSDDGGYAVYYVTTTGAVRSSFPFTRTGYSCNSGLTVQTYASGSPTLWLADTDADNIVASDLSGNPLQGAFGADIASGIGGIESLAFDSVTFPGQCAVWENSANYTSPTIAAYQIPCTPEPPAPAAPALQTVPQGTNQNGPNLYSLLGSDPVNTATGAFTYSHTDLALPGRGPALSFVRTYNSNDDRDGSLSPGWSHNYDIRLRVPQLENTGGGLIAVVSDVYLMGPLGRSDHYTRNSDGSYALPPGVSTKLVQNSNGTWTATLKDQTTWSFDPTGNLTAIADRYGNTSTVTHNASGQVATVSDPAARGVLTFT